MADRSIVWDEAALLGIHFDNAFTQNDLVVRCMDERTPGGIHAAGSGLLINAGEGKFDNDQTAQIEFLQRSNAKGITRHRGCGAEAAWTKAMNLSAEEAEETLETRAVAISNELGVSYEMIEFEAMAPFGPKDGHKTAVIYYDATGLFDYVKMPELPAGFIVSRGLHQNAEYSLFEVNFAVGIILGHHGLGEDWLKENNKKITLVAIGSIDITNGQLISELEGVQSKYPEYVEIKTLRK